MARRAPPEVGQHYDALGNHGAPIGTWEVSRLFTSHVDGVAYAELTQVNDPTRRKTVAVSALTDPRLYSPKSKRNELRG